MSGRMILDILRRLSGAVAGPEHGFYVRVEPVRPGAAARIIGPRELHDALAIAARIDGRASIFAEGAQ